MYRSDKWKGANMGKSLKMTYHEQTDMENTLKLREVLKSLPAFANDFFRAVSTTTSTSTRIKYAYDLRIFFQFLLMENPVFQNCTVDDLTLDVLDSITALDIEEYIEYLKAYKDSRDEYTTNGEKGLKRKLSSLRTFYSYFFKKEMIQTNPTLLVDMPKLHEKEIIRLDPDEVARLLDFVESCGEGLTPHQKAYYEKTKERDLAIITLLLGTGNSGVRVRRPGC